MTAAEAEAWLRERMCGVINGLRAQGWAVRLSGTATLTEIPAPQIDVAPPDPAALAELSTPTIDHTIAAPTGNLCPECQSAMRPSGGCELCPNCGTTSSCG